MSRITAIERQIAALAAQAHERAGPVLALLNGPWGAVFTTAISIVVLLAIRRLLAGAPIRAAGFFLIAVLALGAFGSGGALLVSSAHYFNGASNEMGQISGVFSQLTNGS